MTYPNDPSPRPPAGGQQPQPVPYSQAGQYGQPSQYGPPPPGYPPPAQAPPKKRSRLPLVLGIVGVVLLVCCGGGLIAYYATRGDDDGGSAGGAAATVGQPGRDGQFEFTVTKAQCGVGKVGTSPLGKTAQGQYCLVTVVVRNIGKEPRTLSGANQTAFDASGAKYTTDGEAGLYANPNNETFLNDINPGNQVTAVLVFDVPKDRKLAKVELHDAPFSGGVTVNLS